MPSRGANSLNCGAIDGTGRPPSLRVVRFSAAGCQGVSRHCQPGAPRGPKDPVGLDGSEWLFDPGDGDHAAHPLDGNVGVAQEPCPVHQDKLLGEVHD